MEKVKFRTLAQSIIEEHIKLGIYQLMLEKGKDQVVELNFAPLQTIENVLKSLDVKGVVATHRSYLDINGIYADYFLYYKFSDGRVLLIHATGYTGTAEMSWAKPDDTKGYGWEEIERK